GQAGTGEHANVLRDLLLQVDAHSGTASVEAHRVDIGGLSGQLSKGDCIGEFSRPAAAEKAGDLELARLSPQLVSLLDLCHQLVLLEAGVEIESVGTYATGRGFRKIEDAPAQCPAALIPLGSRAIGISPTIAGVVERAGIDVHPVQEIQLGIVRVFVRIEDVDNGKPADCQHEPVFRLPSRELTEVGLYLVR